MPICIVLSFILENQTQGHKERLVALFGSQSLMRDSIMLEKFNISTVVVHTIIAQSIIY